MTATELNVHPAGVAFDALADSYDTIFTETAIGRAQRSVVWEKAANAFHAGDHVLELNCGTGEDALFLANRGISVTACDASPRMIERARGRLDSANPQTPVEFQVLSIEQLDQLSATCCFDGVLSNFSGLNCVADLCKPARELGYRLASGAQLLLCFSTRYCMWEILSYALRGDFRKAFRRCSGSAIASIGGNEFPVYYPTLHAIMKSFGPMYRLRSVTGIGVAVPPSYLEDWAWRHPRYMRRLEASDRVLGRAPCLRVLGDHMLLHLERV